LEPGAAAAATEARKIRKTGECSVGLIATEATIASNAYATAIARLDPQIHVISRACPLLVPMIEEGRPADHPVVQMVLAEYLAPIKALKPEALIMGCTHYPIYAAAIGHCLGPQTRLIDSADQTALVAAQKLSIMGLLNPETGSGSLTCYVTDQGQRFESVASRFLGRSITQPVWVDPELLEATPLEQT